MNRAESRRRPLQQGFTLLEVIIALLMIGLIMTASYGVLFTTMEARDLIEKTNLENRIGPSILDMIEKDVSGAWCFNIHKNDVFKGEQNNINGERADFFHFIATSNSSYTMENDDTQVSSDLTEISYRLMQNPRNPDILELWRRQDFHVDDEIAEGGAYELIYSRIRTFQISYFSDLHEDAERLDEWDTTKRGRLPAAMEIFLVLEIDPTLAGFTLDQLRKTIEYHRVVFFPDDSKLTMAVRPVVPVFQDPEEDEEAVEEGFGGGKGAGGGMGFEEGKDTTTLDKGDGTSVSFEGRGPPKDYFEGGLPEDFEPDDQDIRELMNLLGGSKRGGY